MQSGARTASAAVASRRGARERPGRRQRGTPATGIGPQEHGPWTRPPGRGSLAHHWPARAVANVPLRHLCPVAAAWAEQVADLRRGRLWPAGAPAWVWEPAKGPA
eukprot:3332168-Pyramimonas_sp.AAC.1